ncbi:MAG TPA: PAS domain S-box protein [Burkholderiales bacterium]|nr:PAS domain S-box protein [Burkholderiales bacterium]
MVISNLWATATSGSGFWLRYAGSGALTLLSVIVVALLWRRMGAITDPGLILLFTVAASTYMAGGMAGMLSAAIVLFGSFVLFSHPLYPFRYSELDWRQMMVIVVACPVIALMVGSLKEQVDQLKSMVRQAQALRDEIRRLELAKDALGVCEQRFRGLVESVPDYAVCSLDPNGAVKSWNTGAERVLGYNDPEIVGQSYSRFFIKEDLLAKHPDRLIEQARLAGRAEQEGWRLRKGGTRLRARTSIIALRDSKGVATGYLMVVRDMTPLEEANLAALRAQVELEALRAGRTPAST